MIDRGFFLGFIKIHILYCASKEAIFRLAIAKELVRHGYDVSRGTLYPTLHRLKEDGYLASNTEVVDGKVRKYYRATGKEKNILESSKSKIHELTRAILEDR